MGVGEDQEGASLSFYAAYDFHHVRCYLSTNINKWRLCTLVCCLSGEPFGSAVTQWPSKHLPIPQPATPSWPSSPHASGDGLCLSKQLAGGAEDAEDYKARRPSHLVALGHVFQANQPNKNQPPTFLILSHPSSLAPSLAPCECSSHDGEAQPVSHED